jgi:hypothetical protein
VLIARLEFQLQACREALPKIFVQKEVAIHRQRELERLYDLHGALGVPVHELPEVDHLAKIGLATSLLEHFAAAVL